MSMGALSSAHGVCLPHGKEKGEAALTKMKEFVAKMMQANAFTYFLSECLEAAVSTLKVPIPCCIKGGYDWLEDPKGHSDKSPMLIIPSQTNMGSFTRRSNRGAFLEAVTRKLGHD